MLTRGDLRPYQRRAVAFLKANPGAGLFVDMGLGKTVSTLTALADLLAAGKLRKVLVIAPLRVVQGVWTQEARKWQHTRHLTFRIIGGNERQRIQAMQSNAQIHLINVENFRWLVHALRILEKKHGWPYDGLVIDESSMFKTPSAKRFVTMRHLTRKFKRRVILTGTPAPNGLLDVWSQVYIVDHGLRLGSTFARYKSRFFSPGGFMGRGHEPDDGAKEKVAELISPVILTLRAEDWLDLPPLIKEEIWVTLPPKARTLYDKMERDMFLELDRGVAQAAHAAAVSAKCHQIANGAVYYTNDRLEREWQFIHDAKMDALAEVLDGVGSNALVAYYHKPDLQRLQTKFPKAPCISTAKNARDLDRLQREWNAGKHRLMFIHPQGTGHGLNLQDGGHLLIFFSLLFGHEPYRQVIERIGPARQVGKAKRVLVKHIVARGTVDEALLMAQRRKFDDERGFVSAINDYRVLKDLLA